MLFLPKIFAHRLATLHALGAHQNLTRKILNNPFRRSTDGVKGKGKRQVNQSTCIAPCMVRTTLKRSSMDHTAFNLQRTPWLPLPRKRSPDGAPTKCGGEHLLAAHYSFIDPDRMKG